MAKSRRSPYYGKVHSETIPAMVKHIWYSRHKELPETECGPPVDLVVDDRLLLERIDLVHYALANAPRITARDRFVLHLRFWDELSHQEIGEKLDLTRERIRQIEARALRRLWRSIDSDEAQEQSERIDRHKKSVFYSPNRKKRTL